MPRALALLLAAALLLLHLGGCGEKLAFTIISGSENQSLEPIVQDFCREKNVDCTIRYLGSIDIGMAVAEKRGDFDAVWPANGIWIDLFDKARTVQELQPIARSPVILGVRRAKAEALGWIDRPVTSAEVVEAVRQRRLSFLATSATQSNSGAGAFIAMLSAALDHPEAITLADLEKPEVRDKIRTVLSGVTRSAGSSGWLADLYLKGLDQGVQYDAMWNYEAVIAETNEKLKQRGAELLYAIYPADGVAFANSPLGFVDRGRGDQARSFFTALQQHLLSRPVQDRLVEQFRRPAVGEATGGTPAPQWNYDPLRLVTLIRMPQPEVVRAALTLYQESLRRPSLIAYCLDFSGSMSGKGESQLKDAMTLILDPDQAASLLVQHGPDDRIIVLPFDDRVRDVYRGTGSRADQKRLLDQIRTNSAGGGTDVYGCITRALDEFARTPDRARYLAAIALMTDGKSDTGHQGAFRQRWRETRSEVPTFGITFGDADRSQLDAIAEETRARVFDGSKDLREAFRSMRAYN